MTYLALPAGPALEAAACLSNYQVAYHVLHIAARYGSIAEGLLDLAFREQTSDFDGWTVVDFKTDQEFSTEARHYIEQVDLYVRAVKAATELPARGIILVV